MPKYNSDKDQQSSSSNILNSPEKPAFENAGLAFVYKSLINRDPSKRRIKPVESILSMDDDLDDSESDDSDYEPSKLEVEDVEIESDVDEQSRNNDEECNNDSLKANSKTANKIKSDLKRKNKNQKKKKNNDDGLNKVIDLDDEESNSCGSDNMNDDDSSDSDSDSQESDISDEEEDKSDEDNQMLNNNILTNNSSDIQYKNQNKATELELISKYKKILICAVCLGEVSQSDNEIVECDACGISVHELCYGITADDAESIHSDASSASTEPWFCDPCKADVKNPLCELCPNSGGIYKITDKGRWVHMVCALYTLGITFTDTEKLRGPILSGINYNSWGSKNCQFCEDIRFSQTGVCICCDAGMCKTYFHVTCAQREGLLVELPHAEDVDPYIAYCRLHSDRKAIKKKRRNYYALAAKFRLLMKNQLSSLKVEDSIDNQRTLNKLFTQRRKFQKNFHIHESTDDTTPIPRLLDASPSAMRRLTNRCELAGFDCNPKSSMIYADLMDIRRKWYIQPAFSVEFISYYMDRNERITKMQSESQELLKQNNKLKVIESDVFAKYNMLMKKNEQMKSLNETARSKIRHYLSVLSSFNMQNISSPLYSSSSSSLLSSSSTLVEDINRIKTLKLGQKILNLPEMQENYCDKVNLLPISNTIKNSKGALKKEFLLNECTTCKKSKEQHLMALCDSCHLYYHLYCLDPPLRRMPKKTRFGGWQCSNCTENEENEMEDFNKSESQNGTLSSNNDDSTANSDIQVNSNASNKRKLRENPKAVSKYADLDEFSNIQISSSNQQNKKKSNSRSRTKSKKNKNSASTTTNNTNTNSNSNNSKLNNSLKNKRSRKSRTVSSEISTSTSKSGTNSRTSVSPLNIASNANRKRKLSNLSENMPNGDSNLVLPANTSNKMLSPKRSPQISCFVCKKEVKSSKQTIRCDICGNDFHLSCLKPSCNKSPKRRGYTWCCFVCEAKKDQKRSEMHINLALNKNNELLESETEEKPSIGDGKMEVDLKNTNCEGEILKSESKSKLSKKIEIDRIKKNVEQELKLKHETEIKCESDNDQNNSLPVNENSQTNIYDINTVINDIIMLEEEAQNNNSDNIAQEQTVIKDNSSSSND